MKRIPIARDAWLLIGLFLAFALFTAFVTIRQRQIQEQQEITARYSSHSAQSDGTLALYTWLERLGHRVERIENRAFEISDNTRLLYILAPRETIQANEAKYILQWVARGNTLVIADRYGFDSNELFGELNAELDSIETFAAELELAQPLADTSIDRLRAETRNGITFKNNAHVTYAQADDKPLIARVTHGKGIVWLSSAPEIFTNESLANENNAKFVAALFADVPRDGIIAFDEYHLGFKPEFEISLLDVLYDTPWGWGVLLTIVLLFAYLGVNGQRFGRVLPVPKTLARRSPSEYVTSMANLFRRANKRGMVLQHYRHSLKRRLGRPYHLNPELADERYVEMLARLRPDLDRNELVRLLNSLRRTDTSESDLVKTIEQAVTFGSKVR